MFASITKTLFSALAIGATIMFQPVAAIASSPSKLDSNWTLHTAFDESARKVIDTPDAVYFFVYQHPYYKNLNYGKEVMKEYSNPSTGIFRVDKNTPGAKIEDIGREINLSGRDVLMLEINPYTGLMAAAYPDGGIDIISAERNVTYFDALKHRSMPFAFQINNIHLDNSTNKLWVACGNGYLRIDTKKLNIDINADWDSSVKSIVESGNTVFAIIDGVLNEYVAGLDLHRRDAFKPMTGAMTGVTGNPTRILPYGNDMIVYLTEQGEIVLATRTSTGWSTTMLAKDSALLQPVSDSSVVLVDRTDHGPVQTSKGWWIGGNQVAYSIEADENGVPGVHKIQNSNLTRYSSSWDYNYLWTYRPRGRFSKFAFPDYTVTDLIENHRPDWMPEMCGAMMFEYSPKHGLIAVNYEGGAEIKNPNNKFGSHPCAYKNGQWRRLSSFYNPPYIIDTNPTLAADYNAKAVRFPCSDPTGISLDPINDDILHISSCWDGVASINIADPRKLPVISTSKTNYHSLWPFHTDASLWAGTWNNSSNMKMLGVDDDDNLWMLRCGSLKSGITTNYYLYFWPAEARRAALENSDPTLAGDWHSIEIPLGHTLGFHALGYMCKHPRNKGLFIITPQGQDINGLRSIYVYDTKNTPYDTSDDTIEKFQRIESAVTGAAEAFNYTHDFAEDPVTGEVILATGSDVLIFDPRAEVVDTKMPGKMLTFDSIDGFEQLPTPMPARSVCFDEYNRLWIGSSDAGVICVSPDRSKVMAHYTTDNSPLPSNEIVGIGWNPDTKSIFVSTRVGIAEVRADEHIAAARTDSTSAFAYPAEVGPDFAGIVAIHNVPDDARLTVIDHNGEVITMLDAAKGGITHWDLTDRNNKMVPTGSYTIKESRTQSHMLPIRLNVVR
ncbi:MAG: hypothetical protein K2M87_08170 [Muribaculaceae bacterium]|nr:hypothetical protein [Muribaculaceae bacterium]